MFMRVYYIQICSNLTIQNNSYQFEIQFYFPSVRKQLFYQKSFYAPKSNTQKRVFFFSVVFAIFSVVSIKHGDIYALSVFHFLVCFYLVENNLRDLNFSLTSIISKGSGIFKTLCRFSSYSRFKSSGFFWFLFGDMQRITFFSLYLFYIVCRLRTNKNCRYFRIYYRYTVLPMVHTEDTAIPRWTLPRCTAVSGTVQNSYYTYI